MQTVLANRINYAVTYPNRNKELARSDEAQMFLKELFMNELRGFCYDNLNDVTKINQLHDLVY